MLKFRKFLPYPNLIQGISNKDNGNVSFRYGDKTEVLENRNSICKELGINIKNLYEMNQIHGSQVVILNKELLNRLENNVTNEVDGLITNVANVFSLVKTADCFPVICYDPKNNVIAALHVGWRGAVEKIFLKALLRMQDKFHINMKDVLIGIGPGIRQCCYWKEEWIQNQLPEWRAYLEIRKKGGWFIDVPGFISHELIEIGMKKENIEEIKICTNCSKEFFSHFRHTQKKEPEGCFATIIGLRN